VDPFSTSTRGSCLEVAVPPSAASPPSRRRPPAWLAAGLSTLVLLECGGNRWIADRLFALGGGHWSLRDHFITRQLIHVGGRWLSLALWLTALVAWMISLRDTRHARLRRPLFYLLASTSLATGLIGGIKAMSHMDCPWDMAAYGGMRPYYGLFNPRPEALQASGCFPAGHAGAGYAWVALYYFFDAVAPRLRETGLAAGLSMGAVFGIAQQLRGAHFASHDVAALLLCWTVATALACRMDVGGGAPR
jgi:membrane-associated PAP2 superfamily phosphatase